MVKDRVKAEQEQEKAHKKRERRAAVIKGKLYVWGDLTEHDKNDTEHTIVQPQMKKYDPSMRSNTCFFSDVYPDTIFRKIADVFEEQQQDFEISDKKWRKEQCFKKTKNLPTSGTCLESNSESK